MNGIDPYATLGVGRQASPDEIKRAYRRLARKYHPDVNPGDARAEAQFKRISQAYEVLSDPEKRDTYDRFGGVAPGAGFDFARATGGRSPFAETSPLKDLFAELFRGQGRNQANKGADVHLTIDVDFLDAVRGLTTQIRVPREMVCDGCSGSGGERGSGQVRCSACSGSGRAKGGGFFRVETRPCPSCAGSGLREAKPCSGCGGKGVRPGEETLTVRVPAGVDSGSRVRIAGHGNDLPRNGPPGDLYVITRVRPHAYYTRNGDDLSVQVPITVPEATLGARIEVPTVDGPTTIKVPPGTHNGQRFRLRGRGVPALRGGGARGDAFVEVSVVLPPAGDDRTRELMKELARLHPEDPRRGRFA